MITLGIDGSEKSLRVWFLDNEYCTVKVSLNTTVDDVVRWMVLQKFGMKAEALAHLALFASADGSTTSPVPLSNTRRVSAAQKRAAKLVLRVWLLTPYVLEMDHPKMLHLLFIQARQALVTGSVPCNVDNAVRLGAILCYVVFGKFDDTRHRPGLLLDRLLE